MTWSLYKGDEELKPLKFSNGKNQKDIVNEVLKKIEEGRKIIFIRGVCGTGKSAIALNIARKIGKTSIVVPGKALQKQYKKDYEGDKFLRKEDGSKLKISVMTGRNNHECPFLKNNCIAKITKEVDAKLDDIFEPSEEEKDDIEIEQEKDISADNLMIPCKIEIKDQNFWKIRGYLKQNNKIDPTAYVSAKDVNRSVVASVCPYWSPVLPNQYDLKYFTDKDKRKYEGLEGMYFTVYSGKPGCTFYEQFKTFLDSDVIVFNSPKYKLETALNRKPKTEVEIIDECDDFLDSFSNSRNLSLDRLNFALAQVITSEENVMLMVDELQEILLHAKRDGILSEAARTGNIIPLRQTGIYDLLKIILKNPELLDEVDDENYLIKAEEVAKIFSGFLNEAYLTVTKTDQNLTVNIVTTNLAKKFQELVDKNKAIVLMSGTIHSDDVLKNIFGLEDYSVIDAEVENQGEIIVKRTGEEIDCKYSNFSSGQYSREDYLRRLEKCVYVSKKPCLIHINAFSDMPTKEEIQKFGLFKLISREELQEMQNKDKEGHIVDEFKRGEMDVLFSTKVSRGVDFPGEECNSIIFTKYPYPNVSAAFWKILMKTKPQHYWGFYKDKARRELLQKIYRGLRFKEDKVEVLSPDLRVLEFFSNGLNLFS